MTFDGLLQTQEHRIRQSLASQAPLSITVPIPPLRSHDRPTFKLYVAERRSTHQRTRRVNREAA